MAPGTISVTPAVRVFTGDGAQWDAAVERLPGSTHCHRFGWKRVIEDVLGQECVYLGAPNISGELDGVLPLVHVRSLLFGHYLISMPFLNYGGPLGDPEAVQRLAGEAMAIAERTGPKLFELRSRTELPVALPVSHRKVTVVLDLPGENPEALWSQLGSKLRSQIKRPRKEGVEVRIGLDQVDPFYQVFARHMRDLGTPALPRRFFHAVAETFPEDVWFACAYHRGQPVAGGAGFRWHGEFEITWASALLEHKRLAANMLVYWSLMERAMAEGIATFNFGRCTPGGGTHKFKRQWGGRDEPLWWYHQPGATVATPSPNEGRYALGLKLWRKLPVRVATALGPHIVRGLP